MKMKLNINSREEKTQSKHKEDRVNEFLRNRCVQSFGVIFGCLRMGGKIPLNKIGFCIPIGCRNGVSFSEVGCESIHVLF